MATDDQPKITAERRAGRMEFLVVVLPYAVIGFLLTMVLHWIGKRSEGFRWITPYKSAALAAILTFLGFVVLTILTCDSDCRLWFPMVLGLVVIVAGTALGGASFALMLILSRPQKR